MVGLQTGKLHFQSLVVVGQRKCVI